MGYSCMHAVDGTQNQYLASPRNTQGVMLTWVHLIGWGCCCWRGAGCSCCRASAVAVGYGLGGAAAACEGSPALRKQLLSTVQKHSKLSDRSHAGHPQRWAGRQGRDDILSKDTHEHQRAILAKQAAHTCTCGGSCC